MSQKDRVLDICKTAIRILLVGLDVLDPKVRSVPHHTYQQIQNLARELSKEAQELP